MDGVRRSGRIAKVIGIVLLGTDTSGRVFSEDTTTVVLSRHGAGILSKHRLAPDEILTLRFRGGNAKAAIRLVGEMGHDVRGYTYGVAFVDPHLDFWELKFPPPPGWPGGVDFALECACCQTRDPFDQTEVEADVYTLAGYILRFCPRCGTSTEWRRATSSAAPCPTLAATANARPPNNKPRWSPTSTEPGSIQASGDCRSAESAEFAVLRSGGASAVPVEVMLRESAVPLALAPAATSAMARSANRRRDVRARVRFTACVRQGDSGEEIVECDNVSKGGLSFRSGKSYAVDSVIEIAVPYSLGAPAIFVAAAIRHVEVLSNGSLFRYGAAYAPRHSRHSQQPAER
jgi:hypothetical protein